MTEEPAPQDASTREVLLQRWYAEGYGTVTASANGSTFETYLHRALERGLGRGRYFEKVLEVGSGGGQHLRYVKHGFETYHLTDLDPMPRAHSVAAADSRVTVQSVDVHALPYAEAAFSRVLATCLLHHLDDPIRALQEMRRVTVTPGGCISLLIPTDPGMAYRFGKRFTSRRAAIKAGWSHYDLLTAIDHRNHFPSLLEQVKYVFRADELAIDWRPFRMHNWHINAFVVVRVVRA